MRLLIALCLGLGVACGAQAAEQKFPSDEGQVSFVLPSGNVGCVYTPAGGTSVYEPEDGGPELSCDRVEPSYQRFILGKRGKARLIKNVGDASCCDAGPALNYGDTWSLDGFWCKSSRSGLTCTRGQNGFFISRAKVSAY